MARQMRPSNDPYSPEKSNQNLSGHPELYPPQVDELNRGLKHQIDQGSIPALDVRQLYDHEEFPQGEEPYDGYQKAAVPPLNLPLYNMKGSGYLFIGSLYAFLIALIFLAAGIHTAVGGDIILTYLDSKGIVITESSGILILSLALILLATLSVVIGLAGLFWRRTPDKTVYLVVAGVLISVATLLWILFSLPYFDLGMGVSQVAAFVYLLGAILNFKDSRRYLDRHRRRANLRD